MKIAPLLVWKKKIINTFTHTHTHTPKYEESEGCGNGMVYLLACNRHHVVRESGTARDGALNGLHYVY